MLWAVGKSNELSAYWIRDMGTFFLNGNSEINRFGSYHELDMYSVYRLLLLSPVLLACGGDGALI